MVDNVKLLSARRSYEFPPDELRLTALSVQEVLEAIRDTFRFHIAEIATPQATFGPVLATLPPGIVFNFGHITVKDDELVFIRYLHFEPQRIVIDVAGPSSAIDAIYERILLLANKHRAPDGSLVIGQVKGIIDRSDISARFSFELAAMLAPRLHQLFIKHMPRTLTRNDVLLPTLVAGSCHAMQEYQGQSANPFAFNLDMRGGHSPDSKIYYSAAPLDTDAHIAYLHDLEVILSQRQAQ